MNKFDQFEACVYDLNPDIIGITESWADSHVLDSELPIDGYDLFRQDRLVEREGGGVLLYVKSSLCAVQYSMSSRFPEQVWCYILDSSAQRFYIGVCYRTPTVDIYGSGNHELLQDVMKELGVSNKHFMLMGDCNYRYLCWPPVTDDQYLSGDAAQFYYCIEDNFFTQHVDVCTGKDAILDLVITDEPSMVHTMTDLGPFIGSDHNALYWKLEVRTNVDLKYKQVLDYSKADITGMRREMSAIDWRALFTDLNAQDCWCVFKDKLHFFDKEIYSTQISLQYKKET